MSHDPPAEPGLVVDGTGLSCVILLLRLRNAIRGLAPGSVVHVIAIDPAAGLDLPAWCHTIGHHYLGPIGDDPPTYALRIAPDARATHPGKPWHTKKT